MSAVSTGKHLKALKRRATHLQERIKGNPKLSYDKSELAALRWAIGELDTGGLSHDRGKVQSM